MFLSKQSFKKQTYKKKLLYIYLHSYNTDLCLKSSKSSTELSLQGTQSLVGNTRHFRNHNINNKLKEISMIISQMGERDRYKMT